MSVSYILRLEDDKYYVGKSDNIEQRMIQHYSGNGAKWTKLYNPIDIIEIEPFIHKWQESYKTLIMMKKYGVENVRGGPWCQINLSFFPKLNLIDESKTIQENYFLYTDKKCNMIYKNKITLKTSIIPNKSLYTNIFESNLISIKTSDSTTFNIYAIRSLNGKYYISRNNFITDSKFFGADKVESITLLKENSNNGREVYAYTILYMYKYGIDNVRGGGITHTIISFSSNIKYQNYFRQLNENSTIDDLLKIL